MNKSIGGNYNNSQDLDSQITNGFSGYANGPVKITKINEQIGGDVKTESKFLEDDKRRDYKGVGQGIDNIVMHRGIQISKLNLSNLRQVAVKNVGVKNKDSKIVTKNIMGQLPVAQIVDDYDESQGEKEKWVAESKKLTNKEGGVLDLTGDLGEGVNAEEDKPDVSGVEQTLNDSVERDVELTDEELELQTELEDDLIKSVSDDRERDEGDNVEKVVSDLVGLEATGLRSGLRERRDRQGKKELVSEGLEEDITEQDKIINPEEYKKFKDDLESAKKELNQAEKILHKLQQDSQQLSGQVNILGINAEQADALQSEIREQKTKVNKLKQKIEEINGEINILRQQEQSSTVAQENVEINTEKEMPTEVIERRTGGAFIVDIQNAIKKISPDMELEEARDVANLIMDVFFTRVKEKFSYRGANEVFIEAFRKFNATIESKFVVRFDEKTGFVLEIPEIEEKLNAGNLSKVA